MKSGPGRRRGIRNPRCAGAAGLFSLWSLWRRAGAPALARLHSCLRRYRRLPRAALVCALTMVFGSAPAEPQGGRIVGGEGSIRTGKDTVVEQSSRDLVVDWDRFDVGRDESVHFAQESAGHSVLNRIYDHKPSEIWGRVTARGRVWLLNPHGVFFGRGARVSVGSLVASGLWMEKEDFLAGRYVLSRRGEAAGAVRNAGVLEAAAGGIGLAGGEAVNEGKILARQGRVTLAAGERMTVDFDGDGLLNFALQQGAAAGAVRNDGTVEGGGVALGLQEAAGVLRGVVNNGGIVQAVAAEAQGGVVSLVGAQVNHTGRIAAPGAGAGEERAPGDSARGGTVELQGATVSHGGEIEVSGAAGGTALLEALDTLEVSGSTLARGLLARGGDIRLLAARVNLRAGARADASGGADGGEIRVGGGWQGGEAGVRNARRTTVERGALLRADGGQGAAQTGDGGTVVVWSDDTTRFAGRISARGGARGGNGGAAEVSGREHLYMRGLADLRAPQGRAGRLLLDPGRVDLCREGTTGCDMAATPAPDDTDGPDRFSDEQLATLLGMADVTISTSAASAGGEDIVAAGDFDLSWTSANALTLEAGRDIQLAGSINGGAMGTLALNFGRNLDFGGVTLAAMSVSATGGMSGTQAIAGPSGGSTWAVTGAGAGTLTVGTQSVSFSEVENLRGGAGVDTFTVSAAHTGDLMGGGGADTFRLERAGSVTGTVAGGPGADVLGFARDVEVTVPLSGTPTADGFGGGAVTLTANNFGGAVTVVGAVSVSAFSGIGELRSSYGSRLMGLDADAAWTLTETTLTGLISLSGSYAVADRGGATRTLAFSGFDDLRGGLGADEFVVSGAPIGTPSGPSVELHGGAGADTFTVSGVLANSVLVGGAGADTFMLSGDMGGGSVLLGGDGADRFTLNAGGSVSVDSILEGGPGADTFDFDGGLVAGVADGGGDADMLDFGSLTAAVELTLRGRPDADGFIGEAAGGATVGAFTGIDELRGSGSGADRVTGLGAGGTFQGGASSPTGYAFGGRSLALSGFESATSAATDVLELLDADGLLLGGTYGQVRLSGASAAGYSGSRGLEGGTPTAFAGIREIRGGGLGAGHRLTGRDAAAVWTLGLGAETGVYVSADSGGVQRTLFFSGFDELHGGAMTDDFSVIDAYSGDLHGAGGEDSFVVAGNLTGALRGGAGADYLATARGFIGLSSDIRVSGGIAGGAGDDIFDLNSGVIAGPIDGGANDDLFQFDGAMVMGPVSGGAGDDFFCIFASGTVTGLINGDAGEDLLSLAGLAGVPSVTLRGAPGAEGFSGEVAGSDAGYFAGIDSLSAGTARVTGLGAGGAFQEGALGLTGYTFGGRTLALQGFDSTLAGGGDVLDLSSQPQAPQVQLSGVGADGYSGSWSAAGGAPVAFTGIREIRGGMGAGDRLTGRDAGASWQPGLGATGGLYASADGSGTTRTLFFFGFDELRGGAGADRFAVDGAYTGDLNGGGGADEFAIGAGARLTGDILGGEGRDTFAFGGFFYPSFPVTGTIDGNAGADVLDLSAQNREVDVSLDRADADGFDGVVSFISGHRVLFEDNILGGHVEAEIDSGPFANFFEVVGGAGPYDALFGSDTAATWTLAGTRSYAVADDGGTVRTLIFDDGFASLVGGAGVDRFTVNSAYGGNLYSLQGGFGADEFTVAAALTGSIYGGLGDDTFRLNAGGSVSGSIYGGRRRTRSSDGSLIIGTSDDTFDFNGGSVAGTVDGGEGNNILDFSDLAAAVQVSLSDYTVEAQVEGDDSPRGSGMTGSVTGGATVAFVGMDTVRGSLTATGDRLTGLDVHAEWDVQRPPPEPPYFFGEREQGLYIAEDFSVLPNGIYFYYSNFEDLRGGAMSDVFDWDGYASRDFGSVWGGGGTDWLDFSDINCCDPDSEETFALHVTLGGTDATGYSGNARVAATASDSGAALGEMTGSFAGIESLSGIGFDRGSPQPRRGVNDRLTGLASGAWVLDRLDERSLFESRGRYTSSEGRVFRFFSIENLQGGAGVDRFTVSGAYEGTLNGGGGADTFNLNAALTGAANGEAGADRFTLGASGSASGGLDGGADTDTLEGLDAAATWTLASGGNMYAGGALMQSFSNIEVLQGGTGADAFTGSAAHTGDLMGGDGADTFRLEGAGSVAGTVAGGTGADVLELAANLSEVTVSLSGTPTADGFGGAVTGESGVALVSAFSGIGELRNAEFSRLTGLDADAVWTLTGGAFGGGGTGGRYAVVDRGGATRTLAFSAFYYLHGGTGADEFVIGPLGYVELYGGAGADTFTVNGTSGGDSVLAGGAGADTFTVSGEVSAGSRLLGGSGADRFTLAAGSMSDLSLLVGGLGADIFTVSGTVTESALLGGGGADRFTLNAGGSVSADSILEGGLGADIFDFDGGMVAGVVDGGGGADVLDFGSLTAAVELTLRGRPDADGFIGEASGGATVGAFAGMDELRGSGSGADRVTGLGAGGAFQGGASSPTGYAFGGRSLALSGFESAISAATDVLEVLDRDEQVRLSGVSAAGYSGSRGLEGGTPTAFAGIREIRGGGMGAGHRLTGRDAAAVWTLGLGAEDGVYISADSSGALRTLFFSGFDELHGGAMTDDFMVIDAYRGDLHGAGGADSFAVAGVLTGALRGGAGNDFFDPAAWETLIGLSDTAREEIIAGLFGDMLSSHVRVSGGIAGGAGNDVFWLFSGVVTGPVDGGADNDVFDFDGGTVIGSVNGGAGDDSFAMTSGTVTGVVGGGAGMDSLTLPRPRDASVTLRGAPGAEGFSGEVAGGFSREVMEGDDAGYFAGIDSLFAYSGPTGTVRVTGLGAGGAFQEGASGPIGYTFGGRTLSLNGFDSGLAGGGDVLDLSSQPQAPRVQLSGVGADGYSGSWSAAGGTPVAFTGIREIRGGMGAGDRLTGRDAGASWRPGLGATGGLYASADGSGTTRTLFFFGFDELRGGAGADRFAVDGAYTGDLMGGGGADEFTVAAALTGSLFGGLGADALRLNAGGSVSGDIGGGAGADRFYLAGDYGGKTLRGDAGDDRFLLLTAAGRAQSLDGGTDADTLEFPEGMEGLSWAVLLTPTMSQVHAFRNGVSLGRVVEDFESIERVAGPDRQTYLLARPDTPGVPLEVLAFAAGAAAGLSGHAPEARTSHGESLSLPDLSGFAGPVFLGSMLPEAVPGARLPEMSDHGLMSAADGVETGRLRVTGPLSARGRLVLLAREVVLDGDLAAGASSANLSQAAGSDSEIVIFAVGGEGLAGDIAPALDGGQRAMYAGGAMIVAAGGFPSSESVALDLGPSGQLRFAQSLDEAPEFHVQSRFFGRALSAEERRAVAALGLSETVREFPELVSRPASPAQLFLPNDPVSQPSDAGAATVARNLDRLGEQAPRTVSFAEEPGDVPAAAPTQNPGASAEEAPAAPPPEGSLFVGPAIAVIVEEKVLQEPESLQVLVRQVERTFLRLRELTQEKETAADPQSLNSRFLRYQQAIGQYIEWLSTLFIDTGLFEEGIRLFSVIGNGLSLYLSQCEEWEGCAPPLELKDLDGLIAKMERVLSSAPPDQAARYEKVLRDYRQLREEYLEYLAIEEDDALAANGAGEAGAPLRGSARVAFARPDSRRR